MDVTSAIKVNELSSDLLKKGLAESTQEASKMAEEFLQSDMVHADEKPKVEGTEKDKTEILIERMKRQVNCAFSDMEEQVKTLTNQIEMLRNEMNGMRKANIKSNVEVKEEVKVEEKVEVKQGASANVEKPEPKQETLAPKEEKKEDNPNQRQGDLKPGDVNINEFFYCGDK